MRMFKTALALLLGQPLATVGTGRGCESPSDVGALSLDVVNAAWADTLASQLAARRRKHWWWWEPQPAS